MRDMLSQSVLGGDMTEATGYRGEHKAARAQATSGVSKIIELSGESM